MTKYMRGQSWLIVLLTPLKQRLLGVVLVFRTGVQYLKYYRISDVVSLSMQNSLLSCDKGFKKFIIEIQKMLFDKSKVVNVPLGSGNRLIAGNSLALISIFLFAAGFPAAEVLLDIWHPITLMFFRIILAVSTLVLIWALIEGCLLYTSPSPRDKRQSRMPSSA